MSFPSEIDEFVIEHVFYHHPETDTADEYWWREVKGGDEGYIIVWADGNHHHTYHDPEVLFEAASVGSAPTA
jgi:hypothetical protein